MTSNSQKKGVDYVDSAKIKLTTKKVESSPLVDTEVEDSTSAPSLGGPKKSAMKKQNRQYFGGLLNEEGDGQMIPEYPGMHVKRRSEKFGSNASTFEELLGTSSSPSRSGKRTKRGSKLKDSYKLTCMDRLLCRFIHPNIAFFYAADGVKRYMQAMDKEWSPILKLFEWPTLPGGQHKKSRGYNYMTHSIWIIAYAAGTAYSSDNDKEEFYRELFENVVIKAETLGIRLQEFVKPVNDLENMFEPFGEMAKMLDVTLMTPAYFGVDPAEIFGEAIIPDTKRYRIRDYLRLKIYTRDVQGMEWVQFRELRFREQMTRVQNQLGDLLSKMDIIFRKLPSVLKIIKTAPGKRFGGFRSLLPYITAMQNNLRILFRSAKISSEEEHLIRVVFEKAQENVQYIIEQAIFAIINVWEIILMTRLSYTYVVASPNGCSTMKAMQELLKRLPNPESQLGANVQYKWKQFYEVNCASLLRKVPVFIRNTVEIAIHLDGFSNPEAQISAKKSIQSKKSFDPNSANKSVEPALPAAKDVKQYGPNVSPTSIVNLRVLNSKLNIRASSSK